MNEHKHDIDENLLLKFLLGQSSEGENRTITDWLDQDPAHRYILEKLESLWLETGKLVPAPVAVDIEMAWLKLTDRIDFGATDQPAGSETPTPDDVGPSVTGLNMGPDVALQRDMSQNGSDYGAREGLGKGIDRRITGDMMRQDEQGESAGEGEKPLQGAELRKASPEKVTGTQLRQGAEHRKASPEKVTGTQLLQGAELRKASPEKVTGTQLRIYALRIAATLLILAGIYVVIFLLTRPAREVMIAAVNGNITDTIPDGTIITLHQGSTLAYSHDFNENERRIRLSGEAFFEVTRDAARPFVVEAGGADVKVLGTSFLVSVRSEGEEKGEGGREKGQLTMDNGQLTMKNGKWKIENEAGLPTFSPATRHPSPVTRHASPVTRHASRLPATSWLETTVRVEHGRVMLFRVDERTGDTMSLLLQAGMRGRLAKGMKAPVLSGAARPDEMFWKDRSLDFRQTPLREVIALLGKHYGIKVTVAQPRVLDCLLTASFRGESPEQIVSVIAASFNLLVQSTPSGYLLEGAGCLGEKE